MRLSIRSLGVLVTATVAVMPALLVVLAPSAAGPAADPQEQRDDTDPPSWSEGPAAPESDTDPPPGAAAEIEPDRWLNLIAREHRNSIEIRWSCVYFGPDEAVDPEPYWFLEFTTNEPGGERQTDTCDIRRRGVGSSRSLRIDSGSVELDSSARVDGSRTIHLRVWSPAEPGRDKTPVSANIQGMNPRTTFSFMPYLLDAPLR